MTLQDAILDWLASEVARRLPDYFPILAAPPKPGRFTLSIVGPVDMSMYKVRAEVPAKTAADVASYELSYTVGGGAPVVLTSSGEPIEFLAALSDVVSAMFVEIDGSGNRSEPSEAVTLTITDTIAPPQPGAFTLGVVEQVDDTPPPAPAP